jgi:hypothetical protein
MHGAYDRQRVARRVASDERVQWVVSVMTLRCARGVSRRKHSAGASVWQYTLRRQWHDGPCVRPCISYDGGGGRHVATSDPIAEIIGDYRAFAAMQRDRLVARGIDIAPYEFSHLAVRVADWDLYVQQRTLLERHVRRRTARTSGTGVRSPRSCLPSRSMSSTGLRSLSSSSSRLFTSASTGWA